MPSGAAAQSPPQARVVGGSTTSQVCVGCHVGINRMLEFRKKSHDEWKDTIYRMIGRGAQVYPDEIDAITAYLTVGAGQGRPQGGRATNQAAGAAEEATAILARRCQQCHDLERARTKPAAADWNAVLDQMVTLGAALTAAERQTLIEYLNGGR